MGTAALRHTLLVVEDDEALRGMLARSLARLGHVVTAGTAEEALAHIVRGVRPSVVLTDWMMPGTSGLDLLRALRRDPRVRTVPVVVLSARSGPRDVVEGINAGARHYVTKPFKPADLEKKLERLLLAAPAPSPPAAVLEEVLELEEVSGELELEIVAE